MYKISEEYLVVKGCHNTVLMANNLLTSFCSSYWDDEGSG